MEIDDGSEIAQLMRYFKEANPDDMSQGALSERVHFLKCEKGGYEEMCEVAERLYNQGIECGLEQGSMGKAREIALSMYADDMPVEAIAKYANVSIELVRKWIGTASV